MHLPPHGREPFGFRDGLENVALARRDRDVPDVVPDGEVVLGHRDATGATPDPGPLGTDGSFVAIREIHQDVQAFWQFWQREGADDHDEAVFLAAKAMGRWPNGMPLQANAIAALHRIMRRGRVFGPPAPHAWYPTGLQAAMRTDEAPQADAERGLMFIALCGDLRRQLEFILQNWAYFKKFADLYNEVDPVLAHEDMPRTFGLRTNGFARYVEGVGGWVHALGGGYYLMPSQPVLARLAGSDVSGSV